MNKNKTILKNLNIASVASLVWSLSVLIIMCTFGALIDRSYSQLGLLVILGLLDLLDLKDKPGTGGVKKKKVKGK